MFSFSKKLRIGGMIAFLWSLAGPAVAQQVQNKAFDQLLRSMLKQDVPIMTVADLARMPVKPLLLDAREKSEFVVSHLPNAQWIGYETFTTESLRNIPKNTPLVVYCSIGVRSEKIGRQLQAAGFTQVKNLYGSIFEWVNQGHLVEKSPGVKTTEVHAYNRVWGVWLHKGKKVYD